MSALPAAQLVQLVRIAQRHGLVGALGDWKSFLQHKGLKRNDPGVNDPEALREFVSSLLHPASQQQQQSADQAPDDAPNYSHNTRVVGRCIAWLQRLDKEKAMFATSIPPPQRPPTRPRARPPKAASAAATPEEASTPGPSSAQQVAVDAWQLVRDTRAHERFPKQYQLPSYLPGWARTKRRVLRWPKHNSSSSSGSGSKQASGSAKRQAAGSAGQAGGGGEAGPARWSLARPRLLAVDCEMVKTEHEARSLVNVSLVDEEGNLVYSTMVKPRHPVLDCRSDITGLSTWDLEGVTTTRSEVRRKIKALLLESWRSSGVPTILVGHALSHDLEALRLDHQPCIDTALIFRYKSLPDCMPSLSDLVSVVLGREMPVRTDTGRHDSREDAWASMQLVLHELGRAQRTEDLPAPGTRADRVELSKLLVHSIPRGTTPQEVLDLFAHMVAPAQQQQQQQQTPQGTPSNGHGTPQQNGGAATSDDDEEDDDEDDDDEDDEEEEAGSDEDSDGEENGNGRDNGMEAAAASPAVGSTTPQVPSTVLTQAPVLQGGALQDGDKRAVLVFKHAGEANAAFAALRGKVGLDTMGLRQKDVALPSGRGRVKVRMSGAHNGMKFGSLKTAAAAVTTAAAGKGTKRLRPQQQQQGPRKGKGKGKGQTQGKGRKAPKLSS